MNTVTTRMKRISKNDDSAVIPPSHKWTEAGVLPKDWSVQSLRTCLLSIPSYGINEAAVPFNDDLPTYLRITDISEDGQFRPSPRVSVKHPNQRTYFLNEGDLVLARTGASVGKSYLYNPNDGPLVFAGFLIRVSPNPEKLQPEFLAYCLQSTYYWNWVATMSIRSGQPGINGKEYGELRLPLPSLIEQRAISEVLSDVDELIGALDALIAKKRAIKQATMQRLLTGKTRLPGFSGEWETKRLGEVGHCLRGVSYDPATDLASYDQDNTVRLLRANNIQDASVTTNDVQYVGSRRVNESQILQPSDVLVCMANGSKELVGKAGLFKIRDGYTYTFGAFMGCFRTESIIADPRFVFYIFQTYDFRSYIDLVLAGSSINNLKPSDIESARIGIPNRNEQAAIVSVLSDIDGEIAALEHRRVKTRSIKQGMMQQLLSGRVRLIKPNSSSERLEN